MKGRASENVRASAGHVAWLWLLLFLFCLRVVGQLVVVVFGVTWLPPMQDWQSGLLPYPWLLASQILIIAVFAKVCLDLGRGRGFFAVRRPRFGAALIVIGLLYLTAMLARYGFRMAFHPGERWTGGSIPTFFHWVLAGFVLTTGWVHGRDLGVRLARMGRAAGAAVLVIAAALIAVALWVGYRMSGLPVPAG